MSTATLHAPTVGASTAATKATQRDGFFSRLIKAMMEAQQARAERIAFAGLAQLPESQLKDLGYTAEQISKIQRYRGLASYCC